MDPKLIGQLVAQKTLDQGSVLAYIYKEKILKTGIVTTEGIQCLCTACGANSIFSVSQFERHAGSTLKRPSKNIFLHNDKCGGYIKSLEMLKCEGNSHKDYLEPLGHIGESSRSGGQISRSPNLEKDNNNCDLCSQREQRRRVIFCSTPNCPAAFHDSCSVMQSVADGKYYCQKCICHECQTPLGDRTEFSRVFQSSLVNGGPHWNPLVNCDQCGDTYHSECLWRRTKSNILFQRFCSTNCEQLSTEIGGLVKYAVLHPGVSLPLAVVKWNEELFLSFLSDPELSIDTIHSLGRLKAPCAQRIFYAMNLFNRSFGDENISGGADLFQKMLYSHRSTQRYFDHNGFLVVVIEEDTQVDIGKNKHEVMVSEVIAAAAIRIHSQKVAEMPFIATSEPHRRKGFCSKLMIGIKEMLRQLGVLQWVIQSLPEFGEMWEEKFSFHPVSNVSMRSLIKDNNLLKLNSRTIMWKDVGQIVEG